jgi:large subunit ribosomal protein L13
MIINADNLVLGRMATQVAKKLMKGEQVTIINAEKAVITGKKTHVVQKFKKRTELGAKGNPHRGPKFPKMPDRIIRYAIRGMLPWKSKRGKQAFKKLRVYISVPDEMQAEKAETVEGAVNHLKENFVLVGEVSKFLGAKW